MNKFFSVIIPTMWMSDKLGGMLLKYEECDLIKEIIIIDNNPNKKIDLSNFSKIIYHTENENIFVNPAWNIGALLSNYQILLINDDIIIDDVTEILTLLNNCDYDIVGTRLGEKTNDIKIEPINKFPKNHFGSFMFIKNYYHIPNNIKIWFGDDLLFDYNTKRGILVNSGIVSNESKTVNAINNSVIHEIFIRDRDLYGDLKPKLSKWVAPQEKLNVLAVLVNYGDEQIEFLNQVVDKLKSFEKYNVTVIVNSNIPLTNTNIDIVNIFDDLPDYQFLPITCRGTMWENKEDFDVFLFGENDHLFEEHHIDKHLEYTSILPENRISGLIQYEENEVGKFYPGYHNNFDWDYGSVEIHGGKLFAHFTNIHQATFILTKKQLNNLGPKFTNFYGPSSRYSVKCRVNTDIYGNSGIKKMICVGEFKDNLIHHLPNIYINGERGRNKGQCSGQEKMIKSLIKLFDFEKKKIVCGVATIKDRVRGLRATVHSIINQVDELYVYQNDYKELFDFLKHDKIKVISGLDTGINMGDAGKFYTVGNHRDSYYLSIDDDIIYPGDYVTSIIEGIKKYDDKNIVTHHGRSFPITAKNYYNDYNKSVHFAKPNKEYQQVHFPGTGVMGFYTESFDLTFEDFTVKNIADVIVGVESAKQGVKCICLPHDGNWLVSYDLTENKTLFNRNRKNMELSNYFTENFLKIFQEVDRSIIKKRKEKNNVLGLINFNPNKTVTKVDYNSINQVINKDNTPKQSKIRTAQNLPEDRNKINEIRQGSLADKARKSFPKPTRKDLIPNVYSKNKKKI